MTVAILLAIATLLPLVSFLILVFMGKRMGNPIAGIVGTIFIAGSFGCSLAAMILWLTMGVNNPGTAVGAGAQPFLKTLDWVPVGKWISNNGFLQLGIYVDSLTVVMFSMITLVSALVFVFSLGYMAEDKRFPRFFTYLSLFCFSMLGLVIGGTILQLFIFWELVGLCSYLLIGFWYEKRSASNAAIKAFVVNRVGDFGFVIGLGILFFNLGNVTLPDVWKGLGRAGQVEQGQVLVVPAQNTPQELHGTVQPAGQATQFTHMSATMLTIMGIGLFFGAVGKSAQFPLHVWLPDAMEGPTPVSALIHAATMVAAGVYLVGRIFPILTPDAKLFIAITGAVTLTMAALIALAQTDIKKVLAYSTLSQLGYMILAMGIGSWVGGLFHLITHAFFKALLFLGSGSVIHAAHHEQELTEYGGLLRKIPYTAITFGIAVLAIAGTGISLNHGQTMIGFAGFYSKDLIIHHAGSFSYLATHGGKHWGYWLFFILPTVIAYVTAFYMTRCWMLTFWGKPRNQHLYDHAHEAPVMYIPLIVLAVLSVIGGSSIMGVQTMLENSVKETNNYFHIATAQPPRDPNFAGFQTAWAATDAYKEAHGPVGHAFHEGHNLLKYVSVAFLVGIGLGVLIYWNGFRIANALLRIPPLRWINIWLYRRMYFDELYMGIFVTVIMGLSQIARIFDQVIVDGLVNGAARLVKKSSDVAGLNDQYVVDGSVNGVATMAQNLGAAVRAPQTGRIRVYVLALMAAVALGLAAAVVIVLSRLGY